MRQDKDRSSKWLLSHHADAILLLLLCNKAEGAGCEVVEVNCRGTSQECSRCGSVVRKELSVRVHDCPACGLVLQRDINAALNILARARQARTEPVGLNPDREVSQEAARLQAAVSSLVFFG